MPEAQYDSFALILRMLYFNSTRTAAQYSKAAKVLKRHFVFYGAAYPAFTIR
jgi:hypothetical protein